MINEIITIRSLLLVNPAISAAGERSILFCCSKTGNVASVDNETMDLQSDST